MLEHPLCEAVIETVSGPAQDLFCYSPSAYLTCSTAGGNEGGRAKLWTRAEGPHLVWQPRPSSRWRSARQQTHWGRSPMCLPCFAALALTQTYSRGRGRGPLEDHLLDRGAACGGPVLLSRRLALLPGEPLDPE